MQHLFGGHGNHGCLNNYQNLNHSLVNDSPLNGHHEYSTPSAFTLPVASLSAYGDFGTNNLGYNDQGGHIASYYGYPGANAAVAFGTTGSVFGNHGSADLGYQVNNNNPSVGYHQYPPPNAYSARVAASTAIDDHGADIFENMDGFYGAHPLSQNVDAADMNYGINKFGHVNDVNQAGPVGQTEHDAYMNDNSNIAAAAILPRSLGMAPIPILFPPMEPNLDWFLCMPPALILTPDLALKLLVAMPLYIALLLTAITTRFKLQLPPTEPIQTSVKIVAAPSSVLQTSSATPRNTNPVHASTDVRCKGVSIPETTVKIS